VESKRVWRGLGKGRGPIAACLRTARSQDVLKDLREGGGYPFQKEKEIQPEETDGNRRREGGGERGRGRFSGLCAEEGKCRVVARKVACRTAVKESPRSGLQKKKKNREGLPCRGTGGNI